MGLMSILYLMVSKKSIEYMQKIAKTKGGRCLSEIYQHSKIPLKWECNKGHTWLARYTNIERGSWCPKCCNKNKPKFEINDVQEFASRKNGLCLSLEYKTTIDNLIWECSYGHRWESCFHEIKRGSWCPVCSHNEHRQYSIEDCQFEASKKFGECISEEYTNTKAKLLWKCEFGHIWSATFGNIKDNGSWCPECSQSYGEKKFREVIENLTGHKFPKVRPSWLLNEFGNRMEIDGFCADLKVGFEYQGRQHLEFIPYWHKRPEKYEKQCECDKLKNEILNTLGIKMLYPTYKLKPIEFEDFIKIHLNILR